MELRTLTAPAGNYLSMMSQIKQSSFLGGSYSIRYSSVHGYAQTICVTSDGVKVR